MALLEKLQQILTEKNTKITPENIKAGVKIFNIDGALNVPVKIFATKEAMMADTTEPDHEYAMVYGPKVTRSYEGDTVEHIWFPSEVTLDEPCTTAKYCDIGAHIGDQWFMLMGQLSPTICSFGGIDGVTISYTSNDGQHYVASQESDVETRIDIGEYITLRSRFGGIDDLFFNFLFKDDDYLEGIYEWTNKIDKEYIDVISGFEYDDENNTATSINEEIYYGWNIEDKYLELVRENPNQPEYFGGVLIQNKQSGVINMFWHGGSDYIRINKQTGGIYLIVGTLSDFNTPYRCSLDFDNFIVGEKHYYTSDDLVAVPYYNGSGTQNAILIGNLSTDYILGVIGETSDLEDVNFLPEYMDIQVFNSDVVYETTKQLGFVSFTTWHHVITEFDLLESYQILPGVTALGKHGPVTGDGSIYNHLDLKEVFDNKLQNLQKVYNLTTNNCNGKDIIKKTSFNDLNDLKEALNSFLTNKIQAPNYGNSVYRIIYDNLCMFYNAQTPYKARIYDLNTGLPITDDIVLSSTSNICFNKKYIYSITKGTITRYNYLNDTTDSLTFDSSDIGDSTFTKYVTDEDVYFIINKEFGGSNNKAFLYKNNERLMEFSVESYTSRWIIYIENNKYLYYALGNAIQIIDLENLTVTVDSSIGTVGNNQITYKNYIANGSKIFECNNGVVSVLYDYSSLNCSFYNFMVVIVNNNKYVVAYRYNGDGLLVIISANDTKYEIPLISQGFISGNYIGTFADMGSGYNDSGSLYVANIKDLLCFKTGNNNKLLKIHRYYNGNSGSAKEEYVIFNNNPFGENLTPEQERQAEGITDNILYGLTELENENQGGE